MQPQLQYPFKELEQLLNIIQEPVVELLSMEPGILAIAQECSTFQTNIDVGFDVDLCDFKSKEAKSHSDQRNYQT
ncbi:MAG: hypothetical protein EZS28_010646 [Streblomastix strix]|uniref:Uncharacterized protein n=1 Tax=Streblomastix strix TaxID=222440 RepID=A0A5J4WGP6_9EUKA|nr:MAG: hypothetical protein EZS28_010646 [Streblomastix strix]